jgi:hypothetical protein
MPQPAPLWRGVARGFGPGFRRTGVCDGPANVWCCPVEVEDRPKAKSRRGWISAPGRGKNNVAARGLDPRWGVDTDIFSRSYFRISVGSIEFKRFKDLVVPNIKILTEKTPRFKALEEHFSFHIDNSQEEALRLSFGSRNMLRRDSAEKATERGAALLYTLGPTGEVTVILYPATSDLAKPVEDHIYLRIGRYSGYQLSRPLRRDLKDLVAYSCVTSLDAEATLSERLRIWWLRHTRPMQIKGEYVRPLTSRHTGTPSESTTRTMAMALLKPLAVLAIAALLVYFGTLLKH